MQQSPLSRFFHQYYVWMMILLVLSIALFVRINVFPFESGDYHFFLHPWMNDIRALGGLPSLGHTIGNYTVPYVFVLTLLSYLPVLDLYLIKTVSIIFDFILAYAVYDLVKVVTTKERGIIAGLITLFLPTVFMNGAIWGQADSTYTAFLVLSLGAILRNRPISSMIWFAVSFAIKLQAIFLLPLLVILWLHEEKFRAWHFLLIPVVYVVLSLPAITAGRPILDILKIYAYQTVAYRELVLNFPNI